MTLKDSIPGHDTIQDLVTAAGFAAISAVPVIGGPVVELASGLVASRQAARQYEFNSLVAAQLDTVAAQLNDLTATSIVESDEFMAAYERTARAAAETDSDEKRRRLAVALRHAGPWSSIPKSRRQQFLKIVAQYDDIHFAMLGYFHDPADWLTVNSTWKPGRYMMVSISSLLDEYYFPNQPGWQEVLGPVLGQIASDGLGDVPLSTSMTETGAVSARLFPLGEALLEFVTDSSDA